MFMVLLSRKVIARVHSVYENLYSPYNGTIIDNRKRCLKNLSKQSDYDKQLLNGKVIQKTLTSHKFFNKFIFSFHQKFTCRS